MSSARPFRHPRPWSGLSLLLLASSPLLAASAGTAGDIFLHPKFSLDLLADGFDRPVATAFAPDGRLFVAEQRGSVWVVDPTKGTLAEPFIDLSEEVGNTNDRGLLGLAIDPNFAATRAVYLLYTVDPIYGAPDEPGNVGSMGRLIRVQGSERSGGNIADLATTTILMGADAQDSPPSCFSSHSVGSIHFGLDGSLFVTSGDGATFNGIDEGGVTPSCFAPGLFGPEEDLGAFRAQSLDSLAGKVLRIDPASGDGLPDNPYFDGEPRSHRSRLWASGLRNPTRFSVRPGSSGPDFSGPGTLYIGDVGWDLFEELNVCRGGENFCWPCREGLIPTPLYADAKMPAWGCDTLGGPTNPAPLVEPILSMHHYDSTHSFPPGIVGRCVIGGAFYTGERYPPLWRDRYYFTDYIYGWILGARMDADDQVELLNQFAWWIVHPVSMTTEPVTGDLVFTTLDGQIRAIRYRGRISTGMALSTGLTLACCFSRGA